MHFCYLGEYVNDMQEVLFEEPAPPPGRMLAGYFHEHYGYHVRRTRGTRDWLLTLTLSGEGCYRLGSQSHLCHRGRIVLLPPGMPHDYSATNGKSGWEFLWVHFTPRADWLDWLKWTSSDTLNALTISEQTEYARLCHAFRKLVQDNKNIDIFHDELADNALAEILILLTGHHIQANAQNSDPRVVLVLRRLSNEFDRDISVAELAESVSMSPSRLAHLFTAQTGESLMRARMKLRMRHAARLLEITSRQVSDIARDVGFKSLFQFSRQFSRWHDMSPTAYRHRVRDQ